MFKRAFLMTLVCVLGCDDSVGTKPAEFFRCTESVGCQLGFVCEPTTNQCVPAPDADVSPDTSTEVDARMPDAAATDMSVPEADMAQVDAGSVDGDGDGVADGVDNCPDIDNPTQTDGDNDGLGDACDPRPDHADLKLNGHFLLFGGLLVDDTHTLTGAGRSAHGVVTDGELKLRGGFSP